jgi:hypothetical protein
MVWKQIHGRLYGSESFRGLQLLVRAVRQVLTPKGSTPRLADGLLPFGRVKIMNGDFRVAIARAQAPKRRVDRDSVHP